jgi:hypothetical protein
MRVGSAISSLSVRPDKRVFMVYAGLTASGYELASLREEDPMVAVAARAASIHMAERPDCLRACMVLY